MTGDRWFRRLLRLLPSDFRSDYGGEMEKVFREQRSDAAASGARGVLRVWVATIAGILAIGPREHVTQLGQDVRYALRGMRRNPGFVAVAVVTLALGIGANTAIFGIVHAVLLRPLPYHESDRLVAVWNRWDGSAAAPLSDPEFLDYAERSRTLTLAASASGSVNIGGPGGESERVTLTWITPNGLDVLGTPPALGRVFAASEGGRAPARVAIISDALWRRRFGADSATIARTITIDGVPHEIVGVMRPGVTLPFELAAPSQSDVILPLALDPAAPRNRRGGHYLSAFGRLAPDATVASAASEMDRIIAPLIQQYPDEHDQGNFGIAVRPLREDRLGESRPVLLVLSGAVGLVLLIACANVASLMLARGESRRRELAVRTALGASRFRVARQLVTESTVLAIAGALAGLPVAYWCQRLVVSMGGAALPRLRDVALDVPVLVFAMTVAILTGVLFGALPALQMSRLGVNEGLKGGARGGTEGGRARVRRALVVAQVAIAALLLVGAGLLIKSFVRLTSVPSGVQPERVLTFRLSLPAVRYPGRPDVASFYQRLLDRLEALPGVRSAGAASALPLAVSTGDWSFDIEGRPRVNGRYPGVADWVVVTAGYFESLGVPLRRGRLPSISDGPDAPHVVFINETAARLLFPSEDPIGRRIRFSTTTGGEQPWRTIAGVVGDVRHRTLAAPPRPEVFFPHEQFQHFSAGITGARAMTVVVKSAVEPETLLGAVRAELGALDREVPPAQVRTMEDVIAASVADERLNVFLIGGFGGLALALAAVGLYGVMAFSVAQRTREMGVRLAVGATRASVLRLVAGQALRLVVSGLVLGLGAALLLSGSITGLLFDVEPRDLSIFTFAPAVLLAAGLLASYMPALRATRVDPVVALRGD